MSKWHKISLFVSLVAFLLVRFVIFPPTKVTAETQKQIAESIKSMTSPRAPIQPAAKTPSAVSAVTPNSEPRPEAPQAREVRSSSPLPLTQVAVAPNAVVERSTFGPPQPPKNVEVSRESVNGAALSKHVPPDFYTVQKNDSVWSIAQKVWGDGSRWPELWARNPQVENPHEISIGTRLSLIPQNKASALPLDRQREPASTGAYRSKSGDTLPTIARTRLHDENLWPKLWSVNRGIENPYEIEAGTEINLRLSDD